MAASSNYGWLKDEQRKERMSRPTESQLMGKLASMSGAPLSARYGMGSGYHMMPDGTMMVGPSHMGSQVAFTGYGADGQFQKNMPTEMLQTQWGPRMIHEGEAKVQNPDGTMNVIPQSQLAQIQQQTGMPGYAEGIEGLRTNNVGTVTFGETNLNPVSTNMTPSQYDAMIAARGTKSSTPGLPSPTATPVNKADIFTAPTIKAPSAFVNQFQAPMQTQVSQTTMQAPTLTKPALTLPPVQQFQMPQQAGTTTVQAPTIKAPEPYTPPAQQFQMPTAQTPKPAVATPVPQTQIGAQYQPYLDRGLQRLEAYAQGQDPYSQYIRDYYQQRQAGEAAASRGALEQEMAQAGMTGQEALTERALRSRDLGQQSVDLRARLAEQEGARAYQAASALPGEARASEQAAITNERYRNMLGDERFKSVTDRINAGASVQQINSELGTNITQADYDRMRDATPVGERDWDRKLKAATTLLATPGATNKTAAAKILNEDVFPGIGIDFSTVIRDEKMADFNTGLAQMSDYLDKPWAEVKALMEKDGTLELMGVTSEQAEAMFQGLKVNVIDQEWNAITDSDWYNRLPTDDKQLIADMFKFRQTGEAEWDIVNEWQVKDETGAVVRTFLNENDALAYASKNEGYAAVETDTRRLVPKNITTGASVTTPETTTDKTWSDMSTNEKWGEFQKTQADLPEEKQITFDAWKNAEMPKSYDAYSTAVNKQTDSLASTMAQKYRTDGWPVLNVVPDTSPLPYARENMRSAIEKMRTEFTANPQNAIVITEADLAGKSVKELVDMGSKPIVLEGTNTPFLFDISSLADGKIALISLADGVYKTIGLKQ